MALENTTNNSIFSLECFLLDVNFDFAKHLFIAHIWTFNSCQLCFLFHRRWWKRRCDSRRVEDTSTSHTVERALMLLGAKRSHCRIDCTAIFRDPQNRRASRKLQHVLHHKNIDRNSWLYNSRYVRFHHDWHCDRTLSRIVSSPSL